MQFTTSTEIRDEDLRSIETTLRKAAEEAKYPKYFGPKETIELIVSASAPSIEELAAEANGQPEAQGDPTFCAIAYAAARGLCRGNPTCDAIAYAAYQACLNA